ncbi:TlpA disulfide reductase family protein [Tundrisphaera lichenicola]|uniref:TlpA disulfide reductase family protein n=1 Tax=Tundrisphaera lichenicola TaxID=2029860 RepID=UPI003EC1361F
MSRFSLKLGTMIVLGGSFLTAFPAMAEDRPADKILEEIKAVEMPKLPTDRNDPNARRTFLTERQKAMEKRAVLIGELYKAHPDNPELTTLMVERWGARTAPADVLEETKAEIEAVLANSKSEKLRNEAGFIKVALAFQKAGRDGKAEDLIPVFEDFAKQFPKDQRGAMILSTLANRVTDEAKRDELYKRMERDYPDSPAVKSLAGERKQREAVGKPFELEFTEAIKGTQITMAGLKGKVVVIDFWATWCGPCIAEMPNMKKLYAEYKDKGVEFIGVSLDAPKEEGGLDKLKEYVAKNQIEWPQYYQGKGWESEFSMSWGINGIPCVFLVDAEGNLASTQARGMLEKMIPEYLEKAKDKKTAANP